MKKQVRVFPDWTASALWHPKPKCTEIDELVFEGIVPDSLMMLLRYWKWDWEKCNYEENGVPYSWWQDGRQIVEWMNDAQDVYEFIYEADK